MKENCTSRLLQTNNHIINGWTLIGGHIEGNTLYEVLVSIVTFYGKG